jgi:hypothetical protein
MDHKELSKNLRTEVDRINGSPPGTAWWRKDQLPGPVLECFVNTSRASMVGTKVTFVDVFKGRNGDYDPVYFGVLYDHIVGVGGGNPRFVDVNVIRTVRESFSVASLEGSGL